MVAAGGISTREGNQESSPNPKTRRQGLYWIHGPLGPNWVVQHHGLKKPGYSGYRLGDFGTRFGHPVLSPDTSSFGTETLEFC